MSVAGDRTRVLIEDWLPITELGIESVRERAALHSLPPLSFLHVWWARRPLVASAAVVLAGLMPAWSPELAEAHPEIPETESEQAYRSWLLRLVGIWGDPVAAKQQLDTANAAGAKIPGNAYGYLQAYKNSTSWSDIHKLHGVLKATWGDELPTVLDPTAGGGSIPFVAARLGLPTIANDLNGVAAAVLRAGVEVPSAHGSALVPHLKQWGEVLVGRVEDRLKKFFPLRSDEAIVAYLWTYTIDCPRTGRPVPLLNNKWLRKDKGTEASVVLDAPEAGSPIDTLRFRIVTGSAVDKSDADRGFVSRGSGVSPYDNLVIDGAYIKAEAQAGRMRQVPYAVAVRTAKGDRTFRSPTPEEIAAIQAASREFERVKDDWQKNGVIPAEAIPPGNDQRPMHYGMQTWLDMFTPRQALVHGTFGDEYARLIPEVRAALGEDLGNAVLFELALMQGKALNYNSRLSFWHTPRQTMGNVFSKHDFAFMWTFAEFVGASGGGGSVGVYSWCLPQLHQTYAKIAALVEETGGDVLSTGGRVPRQVTVTQGSAAHQPHLPDNSVAHLCMDPPYYDNVMYAELSDYFYVWEKRTLGRVEPRYFTGELADKDNEAVANPARFADMGKRKNELATLDYQSKMTAIFAECRRVLRDDGVMTVMFTHKRADAWDTLGAGLLDAGFTIETSWPVNTEAEHSLHQANMNSAASTIMLVCRKREGNASTKVFLEDIAGDIRTAAREAITRFEKQGISGVDLLLSTYGPVLSVISEHYPVYSASAGADGRARMIRPEEALDIARAEVVRLQRARIVGADTMIDAHTDFVLIAWETFKAAQFPFDDARRLALAVGGLDMKDLVRDKIVSQASGAVTLLSPKGRLRRGGDDSDTGVRVDATGFAFMNDAVDTVLYIGQVDGFGQAKKFMDRLKLTTDQRFLGTLQGLVNAIPRTRLKGEWVVPQAGLLDTLITAYFPDITVPAEAPAVTLPDEQMTLL